MAVYTFRHKRTKKEKTIEMKISELDTYKEANPLWEQILTTMKIVDPVGINVTKADTAFSKYVLGKIKKGNPLGGAIERRYTIPKEI